MSKANCLGHLFGFIVLIYFAGPRRAIYHTHGHHARRWVMVLLKVSSRLTESSTCMNTSLEFSVLYLISINLK